MWLWEAVTSLKVSVTSYSTVQKGKSHCTRFAFPFYNKSRYNSDCACDCRLCIFWSHVFILSPSSKCMCCLKTQCRLYSLQFVQILKRHNLFISLAIWDLCLVLGRVLKAKAKLVFIKVRYWYSPDILLLCTSSLCLLFVCNLLHVCTRTYTIIYLVPSSSQEVSVDGCFTISNICNGWVMLGWATLLWHCWMCSAPSYLSDDVTPHSSSCFLSLQFWSCRLT